MMRPLLTLSILLAICAPAQAQDYAFSQQVTQTQVVSGTTCTRTFAGNLTAGSLLIGGVAIRDAGGFTITGVADGTNGAWSPAVEHSNLVESGKIWFLANNASTGTPTVTFTSSDTIVTGMLCFIAEFTYAGGTSGVAATLTNEASQSSTTHSHGSISPAAGGLIITVAGEGPAFTETVAAGYTAFTDAGVRMWSQYRIISAGETTDGAFTTSASGQTRGVIAFFPEPGAGGGGGGSRCLLLGVCE